MKKVLLTIPVAVDFACYSTRRNCILERNQEFCLR